MAGSLILTAIRPGKDPPEGTNLELNDDDDEPRRARTSGREFDMGSIVEFPAARHKGATAPRSRSIQSCPYCNGDFSAEGFPGGRLILTPFEYQTPDPDDPDLDIPMFDELRASAFAPDGERAWKEERGKMFGRASGIKLGVADAAWGDDERDTSFSQRQSAVLCHGMSPELMVGGPRFTSNARIGWWVIPQGDERVAVESFVGHILGFVISHPEYTLGGGDNDRGVKIHDHGALPPDDMDFIKVGGGFSKRIGAYPAGLVAKNGHYRLNLSDGKPYSKVVPSIATYMLIGGFGACYSAYGTAFGPVRDDLVIRAERLRVTVEGADGKPQELRGCTLGCFRFASRFEKKTYEYPVPVITLVGKLGEPNGPSLAAWRQAQPLRKALKEGGDWAPVLDHFEPPDPPPEALPDHSYQPPDRYDGPDDGPDDDRISW
jgi:hypothetical protein